eukprot:886209-Prorocentrum_minimum.AAC.1
MHDVTLLVAESAIMLPLCRLFDNKQYESAQGEWSSVRAIVNKKLTQEEIYAAAANAQEGGLE